MQQDVLGRLIVLPAPDQIPGIVVVDAGPCRVPAIQLAALEIRSSVLTLEQSQRSLRSRLLNIRNEFVASMISSQRLNGYAWLTLLRKGES